MPPELADTVPFLSWAEPEIVVVQVALSANVAVTADAAVGTVITQVPPPVQAPLQPVNVDPAVDVAVSVTAVDAAKLAEHVAPQLMLPGEPVTVPVPAPALVTFTA